MCLWPDQELQGQTYSEKEIYGNSTDKTVSQNAFLFCFYIFLSFDWIVNLSMLKLYIFLWQLLNGDRFVFYINVNY